MARTFGKKPGNLIPKLLCQYKPKGSKNKNIDVTVLILVTATSQWLHSNISY
jgi:hypothetical protein